ncbi:MAG: NAD(+)/NADH kinase [Bacteroidales bacterium]|nr:NAD(+)/NADH kinase [Bacteroidales bacterium]
MTIAIYGRNIDKDDAKVWFLLGRLAAGGAKTYFCNGDLQPGTDMVLALGGDGTFLRAINMLRGRDIPIAGINFGRLGFLTSAKVEEGENVWIDDLLKGNYTIQKRLLLKVDSPAIPHGVHPYALNEFSIQRQTPAMLCIQVSLDGAKMPAYWADGVVVSTPTGSTAYSLSVGGPIVTPGSDVFIIAPIAPHNLNVRPIVAPASSRLEISFTSKQAQMGVATLDNSSFPVQVGSSFTIGKADFEASCITFGGGGFIDALNHKLLWGEDKRNAF